MNTYACLLSTQCRLVPKGHTLPLQRCHVSLSLTSRSARATGTPQDYACHAALPLPQERSRAASTLTHQRILGERAHASTNTIAQFLCREAHQDISARARCTSEALTLAIASSCASASSKGGQSDINPSWLRVRLKKSARSQIHKHLQYTENTRGFNSKIYLAPSKIHIGPRVARFSFGEKRAPSAPG